MMEKVEGRDSPFYERYCISSRDRGGVDLQVLGHGGLKVSSRCEGVEMNSLLKILRVAMLFHSCSNILLNVLKVLRGDNSLVTTYLFRPSPASRLCGLSSVARIECPGEKH